MVSNLYMTSPYDLFKILIPNYARWAVLRAERHTLCMSLRCFLLLSPPCCSDCRLPHFSINVVGCACVGLTIHCNLSTCSGSLPVRPIQHVLLKTRGVEINRLVITMYFISYRVSAGKCVRFRLRC